MINGATCDGSNITGCGQTPARVAAGFGAVGVAIDRRTHGVYVTNTEDTSVSVINGTTCNGSNTTGCGQAPRKAAVGNYPGAIAVDPAVGTAYVANGDNTASVIPLGCGASSPAGSAYGLTLSFRTGWDSTNPGFFSDCAQTPATVRAEGLPSGVAVDRRI